MAVSTVNRIKTVANKLTTNSNSIVTIYENSGLTIGNELIPGHKIISFNCFIKNLRALAIIKSLGEITLPEFGLEDTETDKLYKTLDVEWGSPRKQITLYISNQLNTNPNGTGWFKVGSLSLLNPSGYPYRIHNLMDLFTDSLAIELGDNGKIGIQVEDVGYGLLDPSDEVTIHGSYVEEIFVQSPDPSYVNIITGGGITEPVPEPIVYPTEPLFRISADHLKFAEDTLVESLPQIGTSASTVSQQDITRRPLYKNNVVNGKSAIYFDGQYKCLKVLPRTYPENIDAIIPDTENFVIFVVASSSNPMSTILTNDSSFSTEGDETYYELKIISNAFYAKLEQTAVSSTTILEAAYSATGWNILVLRKVGQTITGYVNGTPYVMGNIISQRTSPIYSADLILGLDRSDNDFPLTGYIADVTILKEHTLENVNAIGNYYKSFYNLSWSNI